MIEKKMDYRDRIPEITCMINIELKEQYAIPFISALYEIGIDNFKYFPLKRTPFVYFEVAEIKYKPDWCLDDTLKEMFKKADNYLTKLKSLIEIFDGKTLIDISFYEYGTFPALIISGDNMKKIRFLEADISIDPY